MGGLKWRKLGRSSIYERVEPIWILDRCWDSLAPIITPSWSIRISSLWLKFHPRSISLGTIYLQIDLNGTNCRNIPSGHEYNNWNIKYILSKYTKIVQRIRILRRKCHNVTIVPKKKKKRNKRWIKIRGNKKGRSEGSEQVIISSRASIGRKRSNESWKLHDKVDFKSGKKRVKWFVRESPRR